MSDEPSRGGAGGGLRVPGKIRMREAIEAQRVADAREASAEGPGAGSLIPALKGPLVERLRTSAPRGAARLGELLVEAPEEPVRIGRADELVAASLGCLLLETLRRAGGARVSGRALQDLLERLLGEMSPQARMEIEVEAYEVLQWLAQVSGVEGGGEREAEGANHEKLALIQRALTQERDLEMRYFIASGRGDLVWRRVTPLRLDALKYLHAWCHHRQDERIFRVSRIDQLRLAQDRGAEPIPERLREPAWEEDARPARSVRVGAGELVQAEGLLDEPAPFSEEE